MALTKRQAKITFIKALKRRRALLKMKERYEKKKSKEGEVK